MREKLEREEKSGVKNRKGAEQEDGNEEEEAREGGAHRGEDMMMKRCKCGRSRTNTRRDHLKIRKGNIINDSMIQACPRFQQCIFYSLNGEVSVKRLAVQASGFLQMR